MTDPVQTSAEHEAPTPTAKEAPAQPKVDPVRHVDEVVRKLGHGDKDVEGSGVAALLMHVAAMLGIHSDSFRVVPDDKGK